MLSHNLDVISRFRLFIQLQKNTDLFITSTKLVLELELDPGSRPISVFWIPAFAGMTKEQFAAF